MSGRGTRGPFRPFRCAATAGRDDGNWHYGHWLNGRLGAPGVGDLINAILADHGLPPAVVDGADGTVQGYVVDDPTSARAALEPILDLFGLAALEDGRRPDLPRRGCAGRAPIEIADMVSDGKQAVVETRAHAGSPASGGGGAELFAIRFAEYQTISVRHVRFGAPGSRQQTIGFPGVLEAGQGRALLGDWMRRVWSERERVSFAVTQPRADIVPGAIVRLPASGNASDFLVDRNRGRAGPKGLGAADRAVRADAVAILQSRCGSVVAAGGRAAAGAVSRFAGRCRL